MSHVLLATCSALPTGEPGHEALDAAFAVRGVEARWADWTDPAVDWPAASLVAVRSTWDYVVQYAAFLAWARSLDQSRLLNGVDVFDWNHDKSYLAAGLDDAPTVPTRLASTPEEFAAAIDEFGTTVVKPRVSAGGAGVIVVTDPSDDRLGKPVQSHPSYPYVDGPWIAQPLVESIRTRGETSVFVLGGVAISQAEKMPASGEIRVHEEFGGSTRPVPLSDEAAAVAVKAAGAAGRLVGRPLDYARVDLVEWDGALHVSELELIEPGLYLDVVPDNAEAFADLVAARL
ncbi:hypothetical protein DDE18_03130 [Nocardioides gansuensis]|uniref:ATP-grasp domain-containing protein n=1 Tax=Nocardioides gansuensis TaxID=2138300 RepID=A0A2T8FFV7_9ACTN|nr:hypothetical protein [Nocardioides gansuensis]PVG84608.1 hypothetical protein DDE18_03130 [Nocardioides gansuensis]